MVAWSTATSRFKDFFDIWFLSEERAFDGAILCAAIQATFAHRNTPLPIGLPPALTQDFAAAQQSQWAAFLEKLGQQSPELSYFTNVTTRLRAFIFPVLQAAGRPEPFAITWTPQGPWA